MCMSMIFIDLPIGLHWFWEVAKNDLKLFINCSALDLCVVDVWSLSFLQLILHDFPWSKWVAGWFDLAWLQLLFHSFYIISVGMWCKELGTATIAFWWFFMIAIWHRSSHISKIYVISMSGLVYGYGHPCHLFPCSHLCSVGGLAMVHPLLFVTFCYFFMVAMGHKST